MNHSSNQSSRTFGFMGLSSVIHCGLLVILATMSLVRAKPLEYESVQIDIVSADPIPLTSSSSNPLPKGPPAMTPPLSATKSSVIQPDATTPDSDLNSDFDSDLESSLDQVISPNIPETQLPPVENLALTGPIDSSEIDTSDIESDISELTQNSDPETARTEESMRKNIQSKIDEIQSLTANHLQESERQSQHLKAANNQELAKTQQADAKKLSQEKSKYAQAIAAQRFAENQKKAMVKASVKSGSGTIPPAESGQGTGRSGNSDLSVRALGELRQMAGNPRPQYDSQDRLQQRKGLVSFLAYVTKEGQLKDFKMLQSTGFRELDLKTLKTLKSWKFYPGQEGLVEIPIQWDLVGGPKEAETTLRRFNVAK